jgi:CRP/FNR family transcriptional regulator
MQQILFMSFDRRLAIFLWDEISKTGDMTVHLTHEQIAKYMGSAREVVSRMLKYFSAEGITENTRGGVTILDKDRLRALAMG